MPVGELFLAAFLQVLFDKLATGLILAFACRQRIYKLLKKWGHTHRTIQAVIDDAEDKQLTTEPSSYGSSTSEICYKMQTSRIISDFAFLPFGGGARKCVGDQFALMESTIALAMLLQKFDVNLRGSHESVELVTGATIHTKNGLWCQLKKRYSAVN